MSLLRIFDYRNWEPLDFSWMQEDDGSLNVEKIVGFCCALAFGGALAFGA